MYIFLNVCLSLKNLILNIIPNDFEILFIIIIIISLFSHMVIHYVTHIKHVLKWYSSNVYKIMKKNNHL